MSTESYGKAFLDLLDNNHILLLGNFVLKHNIVSKGEKYSQGCFTLAQKIPLRFIFTLSNQYQKKKPESIGF